MGWPSGWRDLGGGIGGSIEEDQVAFGSGADTIEGSNDLTWNGSNLNVIGDITASGDIFMNGANVVEQLPDDVIEVFSMADFPAPAAGVITLSTSTEYRIKRDLTTSDRFVVPSGIDIVFRGLESLRSLTYSGTGTFFTCTDMDSLDFIALNLVSTSTGSLFVLTNSDPVNIRSRLLLNLTGVIGWDSVGTITASQFFVFEAGFLNCGGVTLTDSLDTRFNVFNWRNFSDTGTELITIDGTNLNFGVFSGGVFRTTGSEFAFHIDATFAATSLIRIVDSTFIGTGGVFDPTGLDETDTRVITDRNAGVRSSKSIGSYTFNDNGTNTSISNGTYVAMNLAGSPAVAGSNIERWSLTNANNGVLTYDDSASFEGTLFASIATESAPTEANYRIAMSINGAVPVFATAIYMPLTVKDQGQSVALDLPVSIVSGDTIQLMIAGDGTSENVAIAHGQITVQ